MNRSPWFLFWFAMIAALAALIFAVIAYDLLK